MEKNLLTPGVEHLDRVGGHFIAPIEEGIMTIAKRLIILLAVPLVALLALGGGAAGFYLFEENSGRLRRVSAYGLAEAAASRESFGLAEGLVGQCAQDRRSISLDHLPPNYLQIASGLGESFAAFEQQVNEFAFAEALGGPQQAAIKKGLLPA